ncbi:hypothetical protein MIND_01423400 [Mycena indigotica]|uniref:Uncharacterized protein n=1 Tax=Mycena indigotica TaxID=2126181 RepID=A0A8H6RYV7_9AGAR|nr:uncharacterized protein MIND_01423400 [Mycena indigotica]KAF7288777.1 hypothetical protein MIND_01423400 [Mycena indigotica]
MGNGHASLTIWLCLDEHGPLGLHDSLSLRILPLKLSSFNEHNIHIFLSRHHISTCATRCRQQIALHTADSPGLPVCQSKHRYQRHLGRLVFNFYDFEPANATHVPTFWRGHTETASFRNDLLHMTSAQYLFGAVFGGVHCLA